MGNLTTIRIHNPIESVSLPEQGPEGEVTPIVGHCSVNLSGRRKLLLASDIHGETRKLERAVEALDWDPAQDTLILLGDLVDRGPDSPEALELLTMNGVLRVLGNHDIMVQMLVQGEISRDKAVKWGGAWYADLPRDQQVDLALSLGNAPVAMTVVTPAGRTIGLTHADCGTDWERHVGELCSPIAATRDRAIRTSLWSTHMIELIEHDHTKGDRSYAEVRNIDHVFHGHVPLVRPFMAGNRTWIDTGACYKGEMTVIDVDRWLDEHRSDRRDKPRRVKAAHHLH